MTVKWDADAVRSATSEADRALLDIGQQVAVIAAVQAPKGETGDGASSIHAELAGDAEVHVSWDQEHFYMYFAEVGTEHQRATPFLRPALDRFR